MIIATPQVAGMSFEATFARPKPFSKDHIDRLATWITDPARGFGLRHEQVRARHTDVLFDYELSAVLFNGNGTLRFNAQGAYLNATGARSRDDIALLEDSVVRLLGEALLEEDASYAIAAHTVARAASPPERDEFLARFRPSPEVTGPGALGYVRLDSWPNEVRIAVEAASSSPDCLFLAWNTPFQISENWLQSVHLLPEIFVRAARSFGVILQKAPL